ncbi:MAG: glycosyltransferase family 25 protein [Pseudomonadota bacterium]
MPEIYAINLDRRPDRWASIEERLGKIRLTAHRISAIDARQTCDSLLDARFVRTGPLGQLGKGDMACTLSHLKAMEAFIRGKAEHALILEDDVRVAFDLAEMLADTSWIPSDAELIKLESYVTRNLVVLLGRVHGKTSRGRLLQPLLSRHTGAAAYLISRSGAKKILAFAHRCLTVPIDHLLFNPNVSQMAVKLRPLQMRPAPALQIRGKFGTDIGALRREVRPTGFRYWRRESIRGYYEVRRLPSQIAAATFRGARLHQVPWADGFGVKDALAGKGDGL